MARALAVFLLLSACSAGEVELRGRSCAQDSGGCMPGFTCDPDANLCVGTGDECSPELTLLPCEPGDVTCTSGCRECRDGEWGECRIPDRPVAPPVEGVQDLCEGDSSTVTWQTAEIATYTVEFYNLTTWVEPSTVGDGTATQVTPPNGVGYKWRIRSTTHVGDSDWRESEVFEVIERPDNPLLSITNRLCEGATAYVNWDDAGGGVEYDVEFWDGSAWVPPASQTSGTASIVPPGAGTGYQWRLRARAGLCTATNWREGNTFNVDPPPSIYQAGVLTGTGPNQVTGAWSLTPGCDHSIEVRRTADWPPPATESDGVSVMTSTGLNFTDPSVALSTLYYYRPFVAPVGIDDAIAGPILAARVPTTSIHPKHVDIGEITIDGDASESIWTDAAGSTELIPFLTPLTQSESDSTDNSVNIEMQFAWDDQGLIFFVSLQDRYLWVDDSPDAIARDDSIEMFFDMGFERTDTPDNNDFHFIIAADGAMYSARGGGTDWDDTYDGDFQRSVVPNGTLNANGDDDTGWSVEGRIPFTVLGFDGTTTTFSPPSTIGFALWVNEDDLYDHQTQHAYKWTQGSDALNPSTWGLGQFSEPTAY